MLSSPRAGSCHPHFPSPPTPSPAHPFTHLWDGARDSCQVPIEAEDVGTEIVTEAGCGAAGSSHFPQRQACCEQEEPPRQPHGRGHLWPGKDGSEARRGVRLLCIPEQHCLLAPSGMGASAVT